MRRTFWNGQVKLRYTKQAGWWPSGHPRLYVRRKGYQMVPLPDMAPDDPRFLAALAKASGAIIPEPVRTGTIAAAIIAFRRSDKFLSVAASTRDVWRRGLDDMRRRYGKGNLADLRPDHIRADLAGRGVNPGRQRLKIWRALCGWAIDAGLLKVDPAAQVKQSKAPKTDGHAPWTRDDVARFRAHWPVGTEQRLAFELLHWTGARDSDVVRMSERMVTDGWMTFTQKKTGGVVQIPMINAPAFAEPDGHLAACLAARPVRHIVFLTVQGGKPRSEYSFPTWFSTAARKAGIEGKTAHGLRKHRATLMAENGATVHQIAAWTGHKSLSEVESYSRSADRRRILMGTGTERESGSFPAGVETLPESAAKSAG